MRSTTHSLPGVAIGAALALGVASPALAASLFSIAQDMHTPNEVSFTSTAPLVKFTGRTSRISGTATVDVRNVSRTTGAFRVDLASLETGIKLRDEHMRNFLETAKYSEAALRIRNVRSKVKSLPENRPVSVFVDGDLTIHGTTKRVTVPAEVTFLPQTDPEFRAGDWVKVSSDFAVKLTDYGIRIPAMILGPKLNNEIGIHIDAMARAGNSSAGGGAMSNPCAPKSNPCAFKGNPCAQKSNPCAM